MRQRGVSAWMWNGALQPVCIEATAGGVGPPEVATSFGARGSDDVAHRQIGERAELEGGAGS
jgi:hypothetical protein